MQEIIRETRKDPEDSPIKANHGSELESLLLNQPKFEGVDPETESRPLKEEVKPLNSNMTNEPIGIQEATIKATSEGFQFCFVEEEDLGISAIRDFIEN
ncbi:hypothetical protein Ddye_009774 [Dipteronia dyeriana]|uniref:Uncharacterized protein n=1 Tax=Dipteronia dyeriana TaxID=168575 RepID=A0AAD9XCE4_9ROSI|nr:hypothetical protein Ddye_009774 [Dipteronia dyeriana]